MKEDLKLINDLLFKMNFPIARLEKITYFSKTEWEKYTKDMDKGYRLIQQANNELFKMLEVNNEK